VNVESCSNSWLIRWATVTLKVSSTWISRFFFSIFSSSNCTTWLSLVLCFSHKCCYVLAIENVLVDHEKNLKIIDFGLIVLSQHLKVRCYILSTTLGKAYDFSYWLNHVKISRQVDCCIQLVEVVIRSMMLQH